MRLMKYDVKREAMRNVLAGIVLAVMLFSESASEPVDESKAAYDLGDYATALRLIRPQAEKGNSSAQYRLGLMYFLGRGVARDDAETVKWYRLAAEQGNAKAQLGLGLMYENGAGVSQDYAEAAKYYTLAADQGDARAQFSLGRMYRRGKGVPLDYVLAYEWFDLAASRSSEDNWRDMAVKFRDAVASKITPEQRAEAQRFAREWKPK